MINLKYLQVKIIFLTIFYFVVFSANLYASTYNYVLEVGQYKTIYPNSSLGINVSDPSIINCTLFQSGKEIVITALKPGTATCDVNIITSGNLRYWDTYIIEVIDITSITIPQTLNLKLGQSYQFKPVIQDNRMKNYLLKWDILDTSIASIDGNGNLVSHKPGTTQVMCTYKDKSSICQLTIEPIYVSDINFENNDTVITEFQNFKLSPIVLPENATNKDLVWKSSNTSVAIVDNKGMVTSLAKGKTVISATSKDGSQISSNYLLTVIPEENEENDVEFVIDSIVQFATKIEQGKPLALKIQPPTNDWKIGTFMVNGIDATNQLINGEYSIDNIEGPIKMQTSFVYNKELSFYDITNKTESIIGNYKIILSKEGNQLCISNIKIGSVISIYTLSGLLIGSHTSQSDTLKVNLSSNYYIISIDGSYFKIKV